MSYPLDNKIVLEEVYRGATIRIHQITNASCVPGNLITRFKVTVDEVTVPRDHFHGVGGALSSTEIPAALLQHTKELIDQGTILERSSGSTTA